MIQMLAHIIAPFGWIQFQPNLAELVFGFFDTIEPTLSSLAILSGLIYFLYENLFKDDSFHLQNIVTLALLSDHFEWEKKIFFDECR